LYRSSETRHDRLPGLAADLVRRGVAMIVATRGHAPALVAQATTSTIPIVFDIGADPVELGLVRSLNRPGGNATGVTVLTRTLTAKRLELLHEIVPAARTIGFLVNPNSPVVEAEKEEVESAARSLGVRIELANAGSLDEIEAAFTLLHAGKEERGTVTVGLLPEQKLQLHVDIGLKHCHRRCPRSTIRQTFLRPPLPRAARSGWNNRPTVVTPVCRDRTPSPLV